MASDDDKGAALKAVLERLSQRARRPVTLPSLIEGWQRFVDEVTTGYDSTLTSGGSAWAANVKISDDPGTAAQTSPRVGVDQNGNLVAAWIDARTTPARVRAAQKPFGASWSASVEVSAAPANVQSLALSVRADGYTWAVWGDTRAGASNQDI